MKKEKAIILLSGGLDSLVTLATAINDNYEVSALHLNYSQATEKKELECFHNICEYYNIDNKLIVNIDYLKQIGGSSLTDKNIKHFNQTADKIPNSYVPFRNGNILAIATSWAEVIGASSIYIGATEADYSGYPDCRRIFFDAMEKAIELGTKQDTNIKIKTPLINLTKAEIVKLGDNLKVPFSLSWSCYFSEEEACGVCDSCLLRLKGFKENFLTDPIKYKKNH